MFFGDLRNWIDDSGSGFGYQKISDNNKSVRLTGYKNTVNQRIEKKLIDTGFRFLLELNSVGFHTALTVAIHLTISCIRFKQQPAVI
jgi:hypothetical protein